MKRRQFLSLTARRMVIGLSGTFLPGCGTLLHSERNHRPHSNQIDWKIAALDGLGLLLFFVPGVIAFAVDFYTGAIYLPLEEAYPNYGAGPYYPPPTVPPPGSVAPSYPPTYPTSAPPTPATNMAPQRLDAAPSGSIPTPSGAPAGSPLGAHSSSTPPDEYQAKQFGLKRVVVAREELKPARIESVVTAHVGRPVSLDDANTRVSRLSSLNDFLSRLKLWS